MGWQDPRGWEALTQDEADRDVRARALELRLAEVERERDQARDALRRLASDERLTPPDPDGAVAHGYAQELEARCLFAYSVLAGGPQT